ncbi:MAG: hypothetical protein A2W31_18615 [Planctomycetes bacterium RBG_16_64_10]|nr:MAG: hypothetical protein A2W31_18615 [Planctomycetes bacterium RBG_16_64_10]
MKVERPPFGDAVGEFVIRNFREPLPEADEGRAILRQIYTLEPTRTGKLPIDPITIRFWDHRPKGDGKEHTVETESLSVEVTSVVESAAPSLGDLQPAAGPVAVPAPASAAVWWLLGAAVVLVVGGLAVWRRRRELLQERLTPRDLAYREMQQLVADRLVDRDVKLFYVCLTGIVRRYIEESTGVRAPEQTTEEFLHEIGAGQIFAQQERRRPKDFLEAADDHAQRGHQGVAGAGGRSQSRRSAARPARADDPVGGGRQAGRRSGAQGPVARMARCAPESALPRV